MFKKGTQKQSTYIKISYLNIKSYVYLFFLDKDTTFSLKAFFFQKVSSNTLRNNNKWSDLGHLIK